MNLTIPEGARQKNSFKHKYLSINRIDHKLASELTNNQSADLLKTHLQ